MESRSNVQSLSLVPKLKYEHVFLTSFSKMRVDLAAQVQCTCTHGLGVQQCSWYSVIPYILNIFAIALAGLERNSCSRTSSQVKGRG